MARGITAFLRRTGIYKRLWISYIFISLIPIVVTCILLYAMFTASMTGRIDDYERQFVGIACQSIHKDIAAISDASAEIAYSTSFQNMLMGSGDEKDWDFYSAYREATKAFSRRFSSNEYVLSASFYVDKDKHYSLYSNSLYGTVYSSEFMASVISGARDGHGQCVWTYIYPSDKTNGDNSFDVPSEFFLSRTVSNLSSGYVSGTLCLRLNSDFLKDTFENITSAQGGQTHVLILDADNRVVSASESSRVLIEPMLSSGASMSVLSDAAPSAMLSLEGREYIAAWKEIGQSGWRLVALVPYDYILGDVYAMGRTAIIVCLMCVLASFLFSYCITRSISTPLESIVSFTYAIRKGDFNRTLEDAGEDEIHDVAINLEHTATELRTLIAQTKENEKERARLEYNALQAQINPHFFANALGTISYYAGLYGNPNIEKIAAALTNILLVNMGKGRSIVTIGKELDYVRDYLLIQSYRYTSTYDIRFEVDSDILSYLIPKFILQPIVENALVHGVAPANRDDGRKGQITIRGFLVGNDIQLMVCDNGTGITPERLREIFDMDRDVETRVDHIGVANVNRRLQLMYGDGYGVNAQSVPDVFTRFSIIIPAMKGCERDEDGSDS